MTNSQRIYGMMWRDPFWAEVWSGFAVILWVAWVYFQPEHLASSAAPYHVISGIVSDRHLEIIGAVVGVTQLIAITLDYRRLRFLAAFLAAFFWLFLASGIWLDNSSAPGVVLYIVKGAANMTVMLLLGLRKDQ